MNFSAAEYSSLLAHPPEAPCLSLYQPTHRHRPDNQQDPIRFRNLVRDLETSLRQRYPGRNVKPIVEPLHALAADADFWNHARDGLAVLAARGVFRVYRLQRPVPELAIVADSFHMKPLLRIVQSADRYMVLGLTRQTVRLYEGNRDALDEIEPAAGVPRTLVDALGSDLTESHLTVSAHRAGPASVVSQYGLGSKKDEVDRDTERFFRAVDRAVLEHHTKPSGLPLLLAALGEHQSVFRKLSHNPLLLDENIDVSPESLSPEALCARAWQAMAPRYLARLDELRSAFAEASAKGQGSDNLADIAVAAAAGRVGSLLVDAGRHAAGRLNRATGRIKFASLARPDVDDLLDDLAELVLAKGGEVVVVPSDGMPGGTGAVATFRF